MNKLDKRYFAQMLEQLQKDGVPATWIGSDRHCGSYPALISGLPGFYFPDEDERLSMFYPAVWKYRYGVHAAEHNVRPTA